MILHLFVFLSGLAGLVYQVLWMRQLGLLFGNTAHAAGATLAAFFAGLAAGSWFWGRRSARTPSPLKTYARLEAGIAGTALLYFLILRLHHALYPIVFESVHSEPLLLLIRFVLALLLIFPPTFCMGGTIPVLAQHMIRTRETFGPRSALLYGVNTLGAAGGAVLAGFFLPLWIGFNATCLSAMGISLGIALGAWVLSGSDDADVSPTAAKSDDERDAAPALTTERLATGMVCFISGFGVLALEVLWTRMFAQVLENSVYTFAAILAIVLLCLAAGALLSSLLARLPLSPMPVLSGLLLLGGVAVALTPYRFMWFTDDLQILTASGSWLNYIRLIVRSVALTLGPPAVLLGTIFPFLMKAEEKHAAQAGPSLGRLAAINTVGAILGSLLCGFVFLETLGMWRTMQVLAALYFAAAWLPALDWRTGGVLLRSAGAVGLVLLFRFTDPTELPIVSVDAGHDDLTVLETWEGSDSIVAVTEGEEGLGIKVNSHYGLGSTGAFVPQRMQAEIPLFARPGVERIFFLGLGTGITAGAALDKKFPDVKRIVTCELSANVRSAAKKYMTDIDGFDATGGLFSDPRSTVFAEDGRHYLMATRETFDLVNADLFVPFRSGAGSLYTQEHFENVKARLAPGGLFVQWLPLYQLTESEFMIVGRTMLRVFPQVSLWRNGFQPGGEVLAFVGHADTSPLPASTLDITHMKQQVIAGLGHRDVGQVRPPLNEQSVLFYYCGNVTVAKSLYAEYPINTDDRPRIEYMAPRNYRARTDKPFPWFVGPYAVKHIEAVQALCPAEDDPLLVDRTAANRKLPAAASAFHRARLWGAVGNDEQCREAWTEFVRLWSE